VVNELVALNEIDFQTRTRRSSFARLHVIRVGTSGALQASTRVGTPIITSYAVGLDNTGLFYESPCADANCERLEQELSEAFRRSMREDSRFHGKIQPYVSRAEPALMHALVEASATLGVTTKLGMTVSAPGFFAPQGRDTARLKPSVPDLDILLSDYDPRMGGQRIENMEMEASFLLHFLGGLGYWAGAICTTINNRREDTFDHDYQESVRKSVKVALLALAMVRNRNPDARVG
jgi:uridine phosphorylase